MNLWWQLYWPYLAIIGLPIICAGIGWWARGWWDRAGRVIERTGAEARGPVTDAEWDQIVQTIKESK